MNSILDKQNEKESIKRIIAKHYYYSVAKTILFFQFCINTPLAIIVTLFSNENSTIILFGLIATLVDVFILDNIISSKKEKAAKIQEKFDCYVLELPWNDIKCGEEESMNEEIIKGFIRSRRYNIEKYKNWYTEKVGKVPISTGRILAQHENSDWDNKLRILYTIIIFVFTLATTLIIYNSTKSYTLEESLILVISPCLPSFIFLQKTFKENLDVIKLNERIKKIINKIIEDKNLNSTILLDYSRKLQDEIFERRKRGQLIPNSLYEIFKKPFEKEMSKWAEEITNKISLLVPEN